MKFIKQKPQFAAKYAHDASSHNIHGGGPNNIHSSTHSCRQDLVFWVSTAHDAQEGLASAAVVFRDNVSSSMFQAVSFSVVNPLQPLLEDGQGDKQLLYLGIHEALQLALPWCMTAVSENNTLQTAVFTKRVRIFQPSRRLADLFCSSQIGLNRILAADIGSMVKQIERNRYVVEFHRFPAPPAPAAYEEASRLAEYTLDVMRHAHAAGLLAQLPGRLALFPVIGAAFFGEQGVEQQDKAVQAGTAPVRWVVDHTLAREYEHPGVHVPLAPMRPLTKVEDKKMVSHAARDNSS